MADDSNSSTQMGVGDAFLLLFEVETILRHKSLGDNGPLLKQRDSIVAALNKTKVDLGFVCDVNNDGKVDLEDLSALQKVRDPEACCRLHSSEPKPQRRARSSRSSRKRG